MTDAETLTELNRMLPELANLEAGRGGLRSPSLTPGGGGDRTDKVPFGIHVDDPSEPAEARTAAGIMVWAMGWSSHFESWYGRSLGTPLLYLASISEQAARDYPDDWSTMMDEARTHHARAAARTGHAPQPDADRVCPSCGGAMTRDSGDHGLSETSQCRACGEIYQDDEIAGAVRRLTIRSTNQDVWVARDQVHDLYPSLDRRTLHAWVQRGHVRKNGNRYHLGDVNARARRLAA